MAAEDAFSPTDEPITVNTNRDSGSHAYVEAKKSGEAVNGWFRQFDGMLGAQSSAIAGIQEVTRSEVAGFGLTPWGMAMEMFGDIA